MLDLETYFEGLGTDDIRLVGHRIGIDTVLAYHRAGLSAQQILEQLPSLNLEKIYATLTYYYAHQAQMDQYLAKLASWRETRYQAWQTQQASSPHPAVQRAQAIKAHLKAQ
jgi:uncharacterized protein (DUF433 family)